MMKNKMMRVASVLLVAVLLSTCAISGTFAKYTSESTANDTARVAKWNFTVGNDTITTAETFTFDLFTTAYTEENVDKDGLENNSVVIAPGTTGSATVALTNGSEVNATYAVEFSANESGVPLQWSVDGTEWVNSIGDLNIASTAINMGGSATISIHWKWAFETDTVVGEDQSNDKDTALGTAATLAEVSFTATVTVTQVN